MFPFYSFQFSIYKVLKLVYDKLIPSYKLLMVTAAEKLTLSVIDRLIFATLENIANSLVRVQLRPADNLQNIIRYCLQRLK